MKFKSAREVMKDAKVLSSDKEEEFGCDYNHIIANHYSLQKYLKENNILPHEALNINVFCKIVMFPDPLQQHLRSEVIASNKMQKSQVFSHKIHVGERVKDLMFKENDRRMVPLLYLITDGFSLYKELIFQTRVYEEAGQAGKETSSEAIKKIQKHKSLLEDTFVEMIESSITCKSNVFFIPISMANGDPVEWFIPNGSLEENRNNAMRLYEESIKYKFTITDYEDCDKIIDDESKSDHEIINFLKEKSIQEKKAKAKRKSSRSKA